MKKINCWEFKKCGREPGGEKEDEFGTCPATTEKRLDGEHGGKNSGRACWIVRETLCKGEKQGSFANKYINCKECDFYKLVWNEEVPYFKMSVTLIKKLNY